MRLFPFLRYSTLQNEEYSEAGGPINAPMRKAHTEPALSHGARSKVTHLESCVVKRERRASFDDRYTPLFSKTGRVEQQRPASVVVTATPPRHRRRQMATSPMDWGRNGSFVAKPTRGWLHADEQLIEGGVCYGVRVRAN